MKEPNIDEICGVIYDSLIERLEYYQNEAVDRQDFETASRIRDKRDKIRGEKDAFIGAMRGIPAIQELAENKTLIEKDYVGFLRDLSKDELTSYIDHEVKGIHFQERFSTYLNEIADWLEERRSYRPMFHFCVHGDVKPYPVLLCSCGCQISDDRDFNALDAFKYFQGKPTLRRWLWRKLGKESLIT